MTLRNQNILFFSSDDWHSGLKTSKYHIASRLTPANKVLFINSIGLRRPTISAHDGMRILHKLKSWRQGLREVRRNLFVYTPILLPFHDLKISQVLNPQILSIQIKHVMNKLNMTKNPLIWTFLPNTLGVLKHFPDSKVIYHCVDYMCAFDGVPSEVIRKMDQNLLRKADLVFTVSNRLYQLHKQINPKTFYMPHGVDAELFSKALRDGIVLPEDLENIPKPIIGCYGLISRDWIDYKLLSYLANSHPDWSIVMIGKIDEKMENLPQSKNIYYLGLKLYEELYKYSRFFDVAIIPFNINQLTIHSNPLKVLEYLAAGKPVVSVAIPEITKLGDLVKIASNYKEFTSHVEESLKEDSEELIKKRATYARKHSWE
ncbi:MAG TPA: glycosyltransferase family 1 protein, partial [Syntrophaceae bacterium]|nr:glycosyltransferase family 1 protein [Syntrophaceae bacterium]